MDRQDRDRYDRNFDRDDFGRYDGYGNNDGHYHSARNLTNEFERDYRREQGNRWDDNSDRYNSNNISYHEGNDLGDMYERRMQDQGRFRWYSDVEDNNSDLRRRFSGGLDRDRDFTNNYSRERDRYSNYQDDYRSYQGMDNSNDWNSDRYRGNDISQGSLRQGYGISGYEGTSDRFNTLDSDWNRGGAGDDQPYYSGSRNRSSNYGSGMGESFPGSNRGVPDTTYGHGSYYQNEGTGMGSTYGGSNYGGGTGYSGGHRGGSFGNQNYGTSSGNYGGYGSTGSGTYGGRSGFGRDSTSHNSNRGTSELGGL